MYVGDGKSEHKLSEQNCHTKPTKTTFHVMKKLLTWNNIITSANDVAELGLLWYPASVCLFIC